MHGEPTTSVPPVGGPQPKEEDMTTKLLTLRDVMAMTALSRSAIYALMAESAVSEADPGRQPRRPLGRAGSGRLHRQPAPRRLRASGRLAETTCPTVCNGQAVGLGLGDAPSIVQTPMAWKSEPATRIEPNLEHSPLGPCNPYHLGPPNPTPKTAEPGQRRTTPPGPPRRPRREPARRTEPRRRWVRKREQRRLTGTGQPQVRETRPHLRIWSRSPDPK